jgi:hypothetical protein
MALIGSDSIGDKYELGKREVTRFRTDCVNAITRMAAGDIEASQVIELYARVGSARARVLNFVTLPGLNVIAQEKENDPGYDAVAEFTTLAGLCLDALNWIENNAPQDAEGYVKVFTLAGGSVSYRVFSSAQSSGLRTLLQNIVVHISVG